MTDETSAPEADVTPIAADGEVRDAEVVSLTADQERVIEGAYQQLQSDRQAMQRSHRAMVQAVRLVGGPNASYDPETGTVTRPAEER